MVWHGLDRPGQVLLAVTAAVGGLVGARLGVSVLPERMLRAVLAILLAVAAARVAFR